MEATHNDTIVYLVAGAVVLLVVGISMARAHSASGMIAVLMFMVLGAAAGFAIARYAGLPQFVTLRAGNLELPVVWMVAGITVFVALYGMMAAPKR